MSDAPETPYNATDLITRGQRWMERIRSAQKRQDQWEKDAAEAEAVYLAAKEMPMGGRRFEFNILHSNIETIVPAVFNSAPVPDIRERWREGSSTPESSVAQQVAQVLERAIAVQIDDGALETEMEGLTQTSLLQGRGVLRLRFDADEADTVMTNERIQFESVAWRDYVEGPSKRWRTVPWVAFAHLVPYEQVQEIEDPAIREAMQSSGTIDGETPDEPDCDTRIWEVWCKKTRKVHFIVEGSGRIIKETDDPMGLPEFFPMVEPVLAISVSGSRNPVCPFTVYRALAVELDQLTKRITKITDGLRVRGLVAGTIGDIEQLALAEDNVLIPIADLDGAAATGGIDKAIAWWPVDQAVAVLRELYLARDQVKQVIYEVTGISDIVRGQSSASETATAQEIKSQWGSIRIRRLQRQIERSARDLFRLMAELICTKFSPETVTKITGIPMTPEMMTLWGKLDGYRIDVESDSTVRADLSRRKGEMSEFLQGTAAFFGTMAPLAQEKPEIAPLIAEIYGSFARQFNLGKQAEDALEALAQAAKQPQQQQKGPSPEEMAMQAELQFKQAELQQKQVEAEAKIGLEREKAMASIQLERQKLQAEMQLKAAELQMKRQDQQMRLVQGERDHMHRGEELQVKREGKGAETMVKVGNGMDDAMPGFMQAMAQVMQAMQASNAEQTAAILQQIAQGNQQVVAAMTAPKQVMRDEQGRLIGVQTPMVQ